MEYAEPAKSIVADALSVDLEGEARRSASAMTRESLKQAAARPENAEYQKFLNDDTFALPLLVS